MRLTSGVSPDLDRIVEDPGRAPVSMILAAKRGPVEDLGRPAEGPDRAGRSDRFTERTQS
jgi:hypothetical protein